MPNHESDLKSHAGSLALAAAWKGILDAIPVGAYTCDEAGLITYFNSPAESLWGRKPNLRDTAYRYCGSLKLYLSDGTPIRHDQCWMALALLEGRDYYGREILVERPGGSIGFGMAHANPLRNDQGRVIGAVNLVMDITAQKKMQADRAKPEPIMAIHHDASLAMIEVAISALAGMTWADSTFS